MKTYILNALNDKLVLGNAGVLAISFTGIEMVMKIILLGMSIIWTVIKIYNEIKIRRKNKDDESNIG